VLGSRESRIVAAFWALRPHQWVKNLLVFVPLITSHNVFRIPTAWAATLGFSAFCLCASAVYIVNDLVDLPADRRHPIKRKRPFASGTLPVFWGLPLAAGFLTSAFLVSGLTLSPSFSLTLAGYFLTTCTYSFLAKRIAILDVIMLAGLYTIRVLAGGVATSIVVSEWLMAFSMFLFVSLAFAKRYAELHTLSRAGKDAASGRDYRVSDLRFLESVGPASGYIAVLVLALYINGDQMKALYRDPRPLWIMCVALMYWIGRVWMTATRGELFDDPIVFALRDRISLILGAAVIVLLGIASYHM
jgi:4-hydroxybenzoate polyprenyltransferase